MPPACHGKRDSAALANDGRLLRWAKERTIQSDQPSAKSAARLLYISLNFLYNVIALRRKFEKCDRKLSRPMRATAR